jgi:hypothetical protein
MAIERPATPLEVDVSDMLVLLGMHIEHNPSIPVLQAEKNPHPRILMTSRRLRTFELSK